MKRTINPEMGTYTTIHLETNMYEVRRETHQGRSHIVVPVVMMVEGVHNGSNGPLFHSGTELAKVPQAWNGIPIAIHHPTVEGRPVSCNHPGVIDAEKVGTIFHTVYDETINGLRAEAWLDEERLQEVSPETYEAIMKREPLEVSVGVFTDDSPKQGSWRGEEYEAIATNHRPDHLALLPNAVGACSIADGCGVRTYKEGGELVPPETIKVVKELKWDPESIAVMRKVFIESGIQTLEFEVNEGFSETMNLLQSKLDLMDDGEKIHFLHEVFPDHCVYEVMQRGSGPKQLYRRQYTINDGKVVFTGDPIPVVRKVEYVTQSGVTANEKGDNSVAGKTAKEGCVKCQETIDLMLQEENSRFKGQEEWLQTLTEGQLDLLNASPKMTPPKKITEEDAVKVLEGKLTPEKMISLLPKEARGGIKYAMSLHKKQREGLIQQIVTNSGEKFKIEDLTDYSDEMLEKLASAIPAPADYSFAGGGDHIPNAHVGGGNGKQEALLPTGMKPKQENKS